MLEKLTIPIILQLVGVGVIIAEIIIPSGGILSIVAALIIGYSLFQVFTEVSAAAGSYFLLADLIMLPVAVILGIKMLARSPVTLRTELSTEEGFSSQSPDLEAFLNREGVARTDLRPAGAATIDGKRVDVVTRGEYIDKDTPVIVTKVTANQIIVRELNNT